MSPLMIGYLYAVPQLLLWVAVGWLGGVIRYTTPMPFRRFVSEKESKQLKQLALAVWAFSISSFIFFTNGHHSIDTITVAVVGVGFAYLTYPFHGGIFADLLNWQNSTIWKDRYGVDHYWIIMRFPEIIYFIILGFVAAQYTPWVGASLATVVSVLVIGAITTAFHHYIESNKAYSTDERLDDNYQKGYIYHYIVRCAFIQIHTTVMLSTALNTA